MLLKTEAARFADLKLDIKQIVEAKEQQQLIAKKPFSKPASKRKRVDLLKEVTQAAQKEG
jgi:hypothetical protein